MYSLETPRLALRPFTEDDFEFLVALNADPDVARFIAYGVPRTRSETRTFLDRLLAGYRDDALGHLAITLKGSDTLIGRCGLTLVEIEAQPPANTPPQCFWFRGSAPQGMPVVHDVELGYTLAKEHWGRGYATEGAMAVRDFGFRELGLKHALSAIVPLNVASTRVAGKLGLQARGQFRGFGKVYDRYELSRSRWLEAATPGDAAGGL
jgi:ribosomal-protein-alanine N-acetyltransferase